MTALMMMPVWHLYLYIGIAFLAGLVLGVAGMIGIMWIAGSEPDPRPRDLPVIDQ